MRLRSYFSLEHVLRSLAAFAAVWISQTSFGLEIVWPTPSRAFVEARHYSEWAQPTASGEAESALCGCVRNNGTRYHEGIDIASVLPRKKGEATDPVFAALPGRVVYINKVAGNSGYGRYVVLVHQGAFAEVYTLYAHLASIGQGIEVGQNVRAGTVLGIMGRSAGGYSIPRERAHLHFEVGLRLSDEFQRWYDRQDYRESNHHGLYNGINLVGWNSLDFMHAAAGDPNLNLKSYLAGLPVGFILKIRTRVIPDIVRRYPQLLQAPVSGKVAGWRVSFTGWGLPIRWEPLADADFSELEREGQIAVEAIQPDILSTYACRGMIATAGGRSRIGDGLRPILQILFGFR